MDENARIAPKRIEQDVINLFVVIFDFRVNKRYKVVVSKKLTEIEVILYGPKETLYENGAWRILLTIPDRYPYKSPSVGFVNKIYHPNVDESSGSVCLNVINHTWTALYDLTHIFDTFLPHLLTYPNPNDPLNHEAASLYVESPVIYQKRVIDYVERYATDKAIGLQSLCFYPVREDIPCNPIPDDELSCLSLASEDESDDF